MDIWDTLEQIGGGLGEARKNVDIYTGQEAPRSGGAKFRMEQRWGCLGWEWLRQMQDAWDSLWKIWERLQRG